MSRAVGCSLAMLGVMLLLACGGILVPLDLAVALVFGWVMYLLRVVPSVRVDGAGVATAVGCLGLLGVGSHAFCRWLYGQIGKGPSLDEARWRMRWTVSGLALVVVMFVAGIAATGVAHQVGWLIGSSEPLAVGSGSVAARLSQSRYNLKQIGLGLHNYHAAQASFPPGGTFDPTGNGLHGWPALLLPYVDEQKLHDRIDFSVPWDDPRNRPAFRTEVRVYQIPCAGKVRDPNSYALSDYAGNAALLGGDVARTLDQVTDGTSNTLMAGEVAAGARPWGDPVNWRDPGLGINRSPAGFGSPFRGGANMLFADGSVRFLKDTTDPQVLRSLSTPDGGETVPPDRY